MATFSFTVSTANAARALPALERQLPRLAGETDAQLVRRYLRGIFSHMVLLHEREVAGAAVVSDPDIVDP